MWRQQSWCGGYPWGPGRSAGKRKSVSTGNACSGRFWGGAVMGRDSPAGLGSSRGAVELEVIGGEEPGWGCPEGSAFLTMSSEGRDRGRKMTKPAAGDSTGRVTWPFPVFHATYSSSDDTLNPVTLPSVPVTVLGQHLPPARGYSKRWQTTARPTNQPLYH